MTEEERVLKEVRDAEYQAQAGTTNRKAHVSSGVGFPISADAVDALKQLKDGEVTLVQLVCSLFSGFAGICGDFRKSDRSPLLVHRCRKGDHPSG